MANNAKTADSFPLHKDIQADVAPARGDRSKVAGKLSVDDIRKAQDSLVENIGALRFAIARIELLEEREQRQTNALAAVRLAVLQLPEKDKAPFDAALALADGG